MVRTRGKRREGRRWNVRKNGRRDTDSRKMNKGREREREGKIERIWNNVNEGKSRKYRRT